MDGQNHWLVKNSKMGNKNYKIMNEATKFMVFTKIWGSKLYLNLFFLFVELVSFTLISPIQKEMLISLIYKKKNLIFNMLYISKCVGPASYKSAQ